MTSSLEIRKILFLSTAHLDPDSGQQANPQWASMTSEYGFLVYVGTNWVLREAPECVQRAAEVARRNGCEYICFDRDADIIDELETWEW